MQSVPIRWTPASNLGGEWYISPEGDLCKAEEMPDGRMLVLRQHKPGCWLGTRKDFETGFRYAFGTPPGTRHATVD
jgi:hypothetical protein